MKQVKEKERDESGNPEKNEQGIWKVTGIYRSKNVNKVFAGLHSLGNAWGRPGHREVHSWELVIVWEMGKG